MRNIYSLSAAMLFMCMLLIPLLAGKTSDLPQADGTLPTEKEDVFRVKTGDEIKELSAEEYVCGVVAAEMPALYEEEALKAQAVAAYTYAARKRAAAQNAEYDITDDNTTDQSFIDEAEQREKWGEDYEKYSKKILSAVKAVVGQTVKYDGEPCLTVYHAISAGKTESAVNVWGSDYPYLQSVESVGDMLSSDYKSEAVFTADNLCELLSGEITPEGDPSGWVSETKRTSVGTVISVTLCNTEISGGKLREKLSLRSSNFDVEYKDDGFHFTVRGYGHGVGLSQYGANCMAQQGSTYREILLWYYPDTVLE